MLTVYADEFTIDGIADAARHYYGNGYGDVAVVQSRDLDLYNGSALTSCVYGYVWTGKSLRTANDLEAYVFKKVNYIIP